VTASRKELHEDGDDGPLDEVQQDEDEPGHEHGRVATKLQTARLQQSDD
jgi:hypothetical protein